MWKDTEKDAWELDSGVGLYESDMYEYIAGGYARNYCNKEKGLDIETRKKIYNAVYDAVKDVLASYNVPMDEMLKYENESDIEEYFKDKSAW